MANRVKKSHVLHRHCERSEAIPCEINMRLLRSTAFLSQWQCGIVIARDEAIPCLYIVIANLPAMPTADKLAGRVAKRMKQSHFKLQ